MYQYVPQHCTLLSNINRHHTLSLTPRERSISDNDIIYIIVTYNYQLILTIDESFKPSNIQHISSPHQSQAPTLVHEAASVTITTIEPHILPSLGLFYHQFPYSLECKIYQWPIDRIIPLITGMSYWRASWPVGFFSWTH